MERKAAAAKALLDTGAVFLRPEEPFTWASGIKSPIYCDNRLVLTSPDARRVIEEGLIELIGELYPQAEALFGTATAGIPHAAIAGFAMDHGRGSRIEGRVSPGQKVVVIEDLISTGGSVISAAQALQEEGAEVLGVVCIFTYDLKKSRDAFAAAGFEYTSLTDFDTVVDIAAQTGYIRPEDAEKTRAFRDSL